MAPSSKLLDWKVVSVLLALRCDQLNWNPQQQIFQPKGTVYDLSIDWLCQYINIVDASGSEARKMPILCNLLMKGISTYKATFKKNHTFRVTPVGKVFKDFRTNYLVAVLEDTSPLEPPQERPLILYELKQSISCAFLGANTSARILYLTWST